MYDTYHRPAPGLRMCHVSGHECKSTEIVTAFGPTPSEWLRSVCFLHVALGTFLSSKGPYSQRDHISVPSHNKTVTFSTARDIGVTERLTSLSPT